MKRGIKTALVTGASQGIGKAYCHALAERGVDLVLVARDSEQLDALAKKLMEHYSITTWVFSQDLADLSAAERIFEFTQVKSIQVDLLINNAGFSDQAAFLDGEWAVHAQMLQVMLTAVVQLCHMYLPAMLARKQGGIINVGSIASLINFKLKGRLQRTLYRPIKAFVIEFTEKLASSYKNSGVHFQCVCPGLTYSEFHKRSGDSTLYTSLPKWMWMLAAEVVKKSLSQLTGKKTVVITGWRNCFFVYLSRLCSIFK